MRGKVAASADFTVVLLQRVAGLRQSLEWLRQRQRARRVRESSPLSPNCCDISLERERGDFSLSLALSLSLSHSDLGGVRCLQSLEWLGQRQRACRVPLSLSLSVPAF